jgi:thymidylate synthase (FAD)
MIPFDKEHHEPRYTFKIITSRSISHQLVRHRVFSFTQSSQRYCNYSKDKFGGEITYVIPYWARSSKLKESELDYANDNVVKLIQLCKDAEDSYLSMISNGATPQEAREVLPNACMTEIIMTGTSKQWEDFFVLRCANDAHPDIKILADQIKSIIYKIEGREE